jgi:hypothetical protein
MKEQIQSLDIDYNHLQQNLYEGKIVNDTSSYLMFRKAK